MKRSLPGLGHLKSNLSPSCPNSSVEVPSWENKFLQCTRNGQKHPWTEKKKKKSTYRQIGTAQSKYPPERAVHKSLQGLLLCWGKESANLTDIPASAPKWEQQQLLPPWAVLNDGQGIGGQRNQSFISSAKKAAAQGFRESNVLIREWEAVGSTARLGVPTADWFESRFS